MSDVVTIELKGWKELAQKLHDLGPKIERMGLNKIAYQGAAVFKEEIKNTDVFTDRTGELRANMMLAKRRTPAHTSTYRVTVRWLKYKPTKGNRRSGKAGKYLEKNPGLYGRFIEYGTSKMRARPYMRPAFRNKSDEALRRMGYTLWQVVEEAVQ